MEYHIVVQNIRDLLTENNLWFEVFEHEPVITSEDASRVRSGYELHQGTKALIVRGKVSGEKKFLMIIVPGNKTFDSKKVKEVFGISDIRFATEDEVSEITGGVKRGGVPPFGNLFGLSVYCDNSVFDNEKIIFNAGDRCFSIGMKSADWKSVVNPEVGNIC
jgi:prolyl-tRNA editing enzyme YbaK/EbsC (Cys-tRNA(Pro) deacylase)